MNPTKNPFVIVGGLVVNINHVVVVQLPKAGTPATVNMVTGQVITMDFEESETLLDAMRLKLPCP